MRLDKYLCGATELTRSQAKRLLKQGEVTVNEQIIKDAAFKVQPQDQVCIEGEAISVRGQRYIMVHKPEGMVCSHIDDGGYPSVFNLLDEPKLDELKIVGRLDADTTGLVLLTSDGQWSHRITSPNSQCPKRYRVTLVHSIDDDAIDQLKQGVMLNGETDPVSGSVERISDNEIWLTISEGKYHQVKRMCAAVSNRVESLHRQQIGNLELDPILEEGEWRFLRDHEVSQF